MPPARGAGGRDDETGRSCFQPLLLNPRVLTFGDTAPYHGRRLGTPTTQGEREEDNVPDSAGCPPELPP